MIQTNSATTNLKLAKNNVVRASDYLSRSALNREKVAKLREVEGHINQALYKLEQLKETL